MSALPLSLGAHIWPIFAAPDENAAIAKVAAADWCAFLDHRAQQLMPGGNSCW